jgi:excisionase family DNA binding protein
MPVKRRSLYVDTVVPTALPEGTSVSPRLYRLPDAARYLSTSVWEIRKRIREGELPKIKIGKRFLLDRRDLDAYIESLKAPA